MNVSANHLDCCGLDHEGSSDASETPVARCVVFWHFQPRVPQRCLVHRHWQLVAFERTPARRPPNVRRLCGLYPHHKCPTFLQQVLGTSPPASCCFCASNSSSLSNQGHVDVSFHTTRAQNLSYKLRGMSLFTSQPVSLCPDSLRFLLSKVVEWTKARGNS